MSNIRVTYSGLIAFTIRLVSVFTGIIFTLTITRQLSEQDFGTWGLIGSLILYIMTINFVVSYWTTREVARGIESGKTALISSSVFSIIGILIYILIAYFVGGQSNANNEILLFATILVPVMIINDVLHYLNLGWKPQAVSYGFLLYEITKVIVGIILIYFLHMGLEGAILATFVAYFPSIGVLMIYAKEKLRNPFQRKFVKKWIKLSWLPLYRSIPGLAFTSDVIVFSVITGSVVGVAYFIAARTISSLVLNTGSMSVAVYGKLLEGGRTEYLKENLMKMLYFAIPFFGFSIVFARPGLFALNPAYEIAYPLVILLSMRALMSIINKLFYTSLQGIEVVDMDENASFKQYIKSKLFVLPTIRIIQYGSYIGVLVIALFIFSTEPQIDLVLIWGIVATVIEVPFVIYLTILIRKHFPIRLEYSSLIKYIIIGLVSSLIIHQLMERYLEYSESIFDFLPNIFGYMILGFGIYFIVTYFIDKRTNKLVYDIFTELKIIKKKRKQNES